MGNTSPGTDRPPGPEWRRADGSPPAADATLETLLDVLNDADARAILEATADGPKTVMELSEACNLSLSTAYRKVDALTEVGLLAEQLDVQTSGNHTRMYTLRLDTIRLSLTDDRFELEINHSG